MDILPFILFALSLSIAVRSYAKVHFSEMKEEDKAEEASYILVPNRSTNGESKKYASMLQPFLFPESDSFLLSIPRFSPNPSLQIPFQVLKTLLLQESSHIEEKHQQAALYPQILAILEFQARKMIQVGYDDSMIDRIMELSQIL